jgi:N-methylhydantoinase B
MLKETVLFHPATRTLIGADLVENFETSDHLPTRLYLKISGIHGRVGWGRLMRFVYRDRLWAYLSNTGHWPDTGGSVPGGFSSRATEVQQEGLRLPPVKLFREGVMDDDILSIILANIRVPDERIGDIKAQVAALTVGEKRLTALMDRYGEETVTACVKELRDRSEQMMRAHIDGLNRNLTDQRIDYIGLSTDEPLDRALFEYLSARERRSRTR